MRMTIRQLHEEEHRVIVIGNPNEAKQYHQQGVPVVGSIGGIKNASKTLQRRLATYLQHSPSCSSNETLMAWGWHAMQMTMDCSWKYDTYAVIDEVDLSDYGVGGHTIIPTSPCAVTYASSLGIPEVQMTEPLLGIEPAAMVVDKETVFEALDWDGDGLCISIIGDVGSWQEIISVAVRFNAMHQKVIFVLPPTYRDRASLMTAACSHDISQMFSEVPRSLRTLDVLVASDCAWSPPTAPYDSTSNVLDVLTAATQMTPLAVHTSHPIASISTIGSNVAWVKDSVEVSGWMLELKSNQAEVERTCAERVSLVRSIMTPTRYIEALKLKLQGPLACY